MAQELAPIFGTGKDGDLVVSGTQDINTRVSCSGTAGSTTLTVASTAGFSAGDRILIHKSRGNTTTNAGMWELNKIASVGSGQFTLALPLANSYQDSGADQSQCVRVPEYRSVSVPSATSIQPAAWDGDIGGIVALFCTGKIKGPGSINIQGKGYRYGAGAAPSTDGGYQGESELGTGGQVNPPNNNNGSAGGGGKGGLGGGTAGAANQTDATLATKFVFGGAGGGGDSAGANAGGNGGNSGGLVLIFAAEIASDLIINAGGNNGSPGGNNEGAGAGGAGGCILIRTRKAAVGTNNITATGGNGANGPNGGDGGGPGGGQATGGTGDGAGSSGTGLGGSGGGAGGRIRIEACSLSGTTTPAASTVVGGHKWCGGLAAVL